MVFLWWFAVLFICLLQELTFSWRVIANWVAFSGFKWCEGWVIDNYVSYFLFMLFVCSGLALVYCFHYFGDTVASILPMVMWFIGVMCSLVVSGSYLLSLVLWEYLGFVSFLLILFYGNGYSIRSSIITLLSSRVGDVGLFIIVCTVTDNVAVGGCSLVVFSVMAVVLSKSASYPLISWLLEAMRAPTPVSSLVHSSTLVAAGVWFLTRYGDMLCNNSFGVNAFILCYVAVLVSAVGALVFVDLKKVVALSTCNNIAWCVIFYILGDTSLCVVQLVTHGVSKCVLFIMVGDLMSSSGGSQSSIGVYSLKYSSIGVVMLISVLVLGLCGLPFIGIFFSKHYFYASLVGGVYNLLVVVMILIGFSLSYSYSCRLLWSLCCIRVGISCGYISFFIAVMFLIVAGGIVNYSLSSILRVSDEVGLIFSLLFVFIQVVGIAIGCMACLNLVEGSDWDSFIWGSDWVVSLFYSLYSYLVIAACCGLMRWESYLLGNCVPWGRVPTGSLIYSVSIFVCLLLVWLSVCFCVDLV